jgi:hypothetical protein
MTQADRFDTLASRARFLMLLMRARARVWLRAQGHVRAYGWGHKGTCARMAGGTRARARARVLAQISVGFRVRIQSPHCHFKETSLTKKTRLSAVMIQSCHLLNSNLTLDVLSVSWCRMHSEVFARLFEIKRLSL